MRPRTNLGILLHCCLYHLVELEYRLSTQIRLIVWSEYRHFQEFHRLFNIPGPVSDLLFRALSSWYWKAISCQTEKYQYRPVQTHNILVIEASDPLPKPFFGNRGEFIHHQS